MLSKLVATFAIATVLACPARAASVGVSPYGGRRGHTFMLLRFQVKSRRVTNSWLPACSAGHSSRTASPGFMVLSSNGGSPSASLGIARIAHDYGMWVLVRVRCLSGCAVIALSAPRGQLFIVEAGAIGLHQAWIGKDSARAIPSMETTNGVAQTLRAYGLPGWVVDKMMRTPPREVEYMSDAELQADWCARAAVAASQTSRSIPRRLIPVIRMIARATV